MLRVLPILALPAPPVELHCDDGKKEVEGQSKGSSVATHTKSIGVIHPPPDIRNIVDTTAQFVANNGAEFEKIIISKNGGNAKFNFLNASDPYHAYYQHRLSVFGVQKQSSCHQSDAAGVVGEKPDPAAQFRPVNPPETEQYTVRLPEGISGEELDIIKLTAQFVARCGKSFFTGLTSREMNNAEFQFLKPTHGTFMFFTALADAYSKVLMPPKSLTAEKLRKSVADRTTVLERCLHRLEWESWQDQARQKVENDIEQERIQMSMIDWHDFVVVEAIDFADDEDWGLPMPMTQEDVLVWRSKISTKDEEKIVETGEEVQMDMDLDQEEMQLVQDEMKAANLEENREENKDGVNAAMDEHEPYPMRIVKSWKRPEERIPAERDPTKYMLVSPITGELVPVNEMSEHMRISLIDPTYKEQKERMFAKIRGTNLANDDEISRNIVGLARIRPDIFGTTEEEIFNAVHAEIENIKDEQPKQVVIWDGHAGNIGHTANQAMSLSKSMGGEDQNEVNINRGKPLPGPAAASPPRPVFPMICPPPSSTNLATSNMQYSAPNSSGLMPLPPLGPINQMAPPLPPPVPKDMMINLPPMPLHASQIIPLGVHRPFTPQSTSPAPTLSMPQAIPPLPEEPKPKRRKLDDSALISEEQFLAQHPGPVMINISVPNIDEGNLKGQLLEIFMPLSETVGSLKEKISGEIQLVANKQKLCGITGFLKDHLTLAYYNIKEGETLALSLRERGGRKR